jgi:hypothetical protein
LNNAIQPINDVHSTKYKLNEPKKAQRNRNAKPITKFVNGPIKATLPNLLLSDNPIITAPRAIT